MTISPKVLVCDDNSIFQYNMKQVLNGRFDYVSAYNGDEAISVIRDQAIDMMLLDIQMRSDDEGLKFIPKLLAIDPDLAIIMSSSSTDFKTVREAMRLGAADYVAKDFDTDELIHILNRVYERQSLIKRQKQQNFEMVTSQKHHLLIGASSPVLQLRKIIKKLQNSSSPIMITGETGTGKEVIARQLRKTLPNGSLEPFLAIDSGTIQSSMAESLLFGHEKGSFTGAEKTTKGIFEEAHGGTVYFDEISNMPITIQAKLLRVLQEKEVTRVGSSKIIKLEFRVICATNRDLEQMAKDGEFKDDLLQRLNVIPIYIAPLRDRVEDIPLLIEYFVKKQSFRSDPLRFTDGAIETLQAYSWPGNIRELGNLVDYVSTMMEGSEVEIADLPPKFRDAARASATLASSAHTHPKTTVSFYDAVIGFESELLRREYRRLKGNISQLALFLEMDRSHLYTKLREYGIHPSRKPSGPS